MYRKNAWHKYQDNLSPVMDFAEGYKTYLSILKLFQAYNWYENQYHLIEKDKNVLFFRKRII